MDDEGLLSEVARAIRSSPQAFKDGGRYLDEAFSSDSCRDRAVMRLKRAHEAQLAELEQDLAVERQALATIQRRIDDHERSLESAPETSVVRMLSKNPSNIEWRARQERELAATRERVDRLQASFDQCEKRGAVVDVAPMQSHERLAEAIDTLQQFEFTLPRSESVALCVLAWLLYDPEAHAFQPVLTEFQRLPWRGQEQDAEARDSRSFLAEWDLTPDFVRVVRRAHAYLTSVNEWPGALSASHEPKADAATAIAAMLSAGDIARAYGLPPDPLRKALERLRKKNLGAWFQAVQDRGRREPQFLYALHSPEVRGVLQRLGADLSVERPSTDFGRSQPGP